MPSFFPFPLLLPRKKLTLLVACALGLLVSGCAAGVAAGNSPLGSTESGQSANASQAMQVATASQIIIQFKPAFATLARADCSASYLALAGAQKGYTTAVKRVLFSGAQVVAVSPAEPNKSGAKPEQRGENRPATNLKTGLSSSEVLAFVSYLAQQTAVEYVELDTKQQGMVAAASKPISTGRPNAGSMALAAAAVPEAQAAFHQACGASLAEPQAAR